MSESSSLEKAKSVMKYLMNEKCHEAANIFQNTSPELRSSGFRPLTTSNMNSASALQNQTFFKNVNATMGGQPRRKRLTNNQKAAMKELFSNTESIEELVTGANYLGIKKPQAVAWYQSLPNNVNNKKRNTKEQSKQNNPSPFEPVFFNTSNTRGPCSSGYLFPEYESNSGIWDYDD